MLKEARGEWEQHPWGPCAEPRSTGLFPARLGEMSLRYPQPLAWHPASPGSLRGAKIASVLDLGRRVREETSLLAY